MITVYGIKNCDTVRKARRWLDEQGVDYDFVDFREQPLSAEQLQDWLQRCGGDKLINRRSTSWRQLSEQDRELADEQAMVDLLQAHPTLIKRPVLEHASGIELGFKAEHYQRLFKKVR